jgi:hypothetical protein
MNKFLTGLIGLLLWSAVATAAETALPQRVLYVGPRAAEFGPFLKDHFTGAETAELRQFKPEEAANFDVVVLDWPQGGDMRSKWENGSPLGRREDWNKPTVLVGSAGLNLAVAWKVHGGSGCTCLAPVAYDLRPHEIFKGPIPVDTEATVAIPTPEQFASELKTETIEVLPLVDGINNFHTVINDNARGWSSHYYEFADLPDVEAFSGGINEQTPHSAAFWRQGNLLHFGFEQSPTELNSVGRALLVNAVVYISRFTEDRPIDISPSVFGAERIGLSRQRARRYFVNFPQNIRDVFSAATLASFDWQHTNTALPWFDENRAWIHPGAKNQLEVDAEAKGLGVVFDTAEFFPKAIAALRHEETRAAAGSVLARYAPEGPGAAADEEMWNKWWQANAPYLFYSELGGYRWYIDPLAKKRGVPCKDLRGPLRASKT